MQELGSVATLRRYPVKSMLGQQLASVAVSAAGVERDRAFALIDQETGRVASAKQPRLWRDLLQCSAAWDGSSLTITLPDGRTVGSSGGAADAALSELLGRRVRLADTRAPGAALARPDPEAVIEHGVTADVPYQVIEIGHANTGASFVDYAPVSLITTGTLAHLGMEAESVRYRPNVVLASPAAHAPFSENDWAGREIRLGPVHLRGLIPTPRCAIPTLAHGALPRDVAAVRTLLTENRIEVSGRAPAPCAGIYAEVLQGGTVRPGDTAVLI